MANNKWGSIPQKLQKKMLDNISKEFQATNFMAHTTHIELVPKKISRLYALWLKITFRKPPMVYRMPVSTSHTITFKRPSAYAKRLARIATGEQSRDDLTTED